MRGKEFKVHKLILAAQSPEFDKMFSSDTADEAKTFKNIKSLSEESFESFLNFFYTGRMDPAVDSVEAFELASEFEVASLKAASIEKILAELNEDNALAIFNLGKQHASKELTQSAFKTLQEVYPDLVDALIDDANGLNEIVVAKQRIAVILKAKSVGSINVGPPLSNASGGPSNVGRNNCCQNNGQTSLQTNGNVKRNEVKDVWKPQTLVANIDLSADIKMMKQCRSILNKLTPENFATLTKQFKNLQIDTVDILDRCVSLVLEKAIMEPQYCAIYAKLVKEVSQAFDDPSKQRVHEKNVFRKSLISLCQREFEKHIGNELVENNELESFKNRRRAVGTVKFIGELCKIEILTPKIILSCIDKLLDPLRRTEMKLECLCKLLTTSGKHLVTQKLEYRKVDLSDHFAQLEEISNEINISWRIRFMIQDLIDLRKNNWEPRPLQLEITPMTLDEIKRQVDM